MAANATDVPSGVLNDVVFLNYLTKASGIHFEVARNLYLATLGALIWDILSTIPNDFALARARFRLSHIPYFLARLSAFGFCSLSVIAKTHPVGHCRVFEYAAMGFWIIASISSSLLLDIRLCDLYHDISHVRVLFLVILCINIVVSMIAPVGHRMRRLENTHHCIDAGIKPFSVAALFSRLICVIVVFVGVSAYLLAIYGEGTGSKVAKVRHALKVLWRGGSQYYLILVFSNLLVAILVVIPSLPILYQVMFTVPDIALTTAVACRVYRRFKIFPTDGPPSLDEPKPDTPADSGKEPSVNNTDHHDAPPPFRPYTPRSATFPFPTVRARAQAAFRSGPHIVLPPIRDEQHSIAVLNAAAGPPERNNFLAVPGTTHPGS